MQRAFDPRAVVVTEETDVLGDVVDLGVANHGVIEDRLAIGEARLGFAAEVEHHLEQIATPLRKTLRGSGDRGGSAANSRLSSSSHEDP